MRRALSLLSVLLLGCHSKPSPSHQGALDTSTVPASRLSAHDTVGGAGAAAGGFDVTGYYFPDSTLVVGGQRLNWLELVGTMATLRFEAVADSSVFVDAPCNTALLSRDTLDLTCPNTVMGNVRVMGTFVDKRGGYDTLPGVSHDSVVMRAQIRVETRQGLVVRRQLRFTFWIGD